MTRSVEITSAAATHPVTLTEVKALLRISGSDDDTMLTQFIAAATDYAERFLSRKLITQTVKLHLDSFYNNKKYEEIYPFGVWNNQFIYLPYPPIISISSVKTFSVDNTEATLSSAAYSLDAKSGRLYMNSGYSWPVGLRAVDAIHITYVCGYGAAADVPQSIRFAIMNHVAQMYECRAMCEANPITKGMMASYRLIDGLGWE
jgi:uncharacterized phiE125 gp8 family phage protein